VKAAKKLPDLPENLAADFRRNGLREPIGEWGPDGGLVQREPVGRGAVDLALPKSQ
jgi:hypothetical protein